MHIKKLLRKVFIQWGGVTLIVGLCPPLFAQTTPSFIKNQFIQNWNLIPVESIGGYTTLVYSFKNDPNFIATIQNLTLYDENKGSNQFNASCELTFQNKQKIKSKTRKITTFRKVSMGPYHCQITESFRNKVRYTFYSKKLQTISFETPIYKREPAHGVKNYELEMRKFIYFTLKK